MGATARTLAAIAIAATIGLTACGGSDSESSNAGNSSSQTGKNTGATTKPWRDLASLTTCFSGQIPATGDADNSVGYYPTDATTPPSSAKAGWVEPVFMSASDQDGQASAGSPDEVPATPAGSGLESDTGQATVKFYLYKTAAQATAAARAIKENDGDDPVVARSNIVFVYFGYGSSATKDGAAYTKLVTRTIDKGSGSTKCGQASGKTAPSD